MILDVEEVFTVGQDNFFDSTSPTSTLGVIFEDDLTTGYFYAIDRLSDVKVLDALHIYDVANIIDKDKLSKIQICWTDNGQFASLLINDYCHAIFDFNEKAGYCRNGFPPCNSEWTNTNDRKLTDDLILTLISES